MKDLYPCTTMLETMDFYDIITIMQRINDNAYVNKLKPELWNHPVFGNRREKLTQLYVERYRGIRNSNNYSTHDFWEFTGVLAGDGFFDTEKRYPLTEKTVVLTPPGMIHREFAEKNIDTIWLGFQAELPEIDRSQIYLLNSTFLLRQLEINWEFSHRNFGPIGLEVDGMLLMLVSGFFRILHEQSCRVDYSMADVVQFLETHFHEEICMADLASRLQCSQGHFFRQFKAFTGTTPVQYLNSLRLRQARFYLHHTKLKIVQIAPLCGFNDPYYFSRLFTLTHGRSPIDYRNNC